MRIAYFVNQYPKVSHSFIRREILALERQGFEVQRIALRGWNAEVVGATAAVLVGAPAEAGKGGAAPAGEQKPVEIVHGVAKQPTAEELLKEEIGAIKVRKANEGKDLL